MTNNNIIGKNIEQLRLAKGLSQQQLAKKAKVAQSSIHYWETGVRTPKPQQIQKLASVLEADYDDIDPSAYQRMKKKTDNDTSIIKLMAGITNNLQSKMSAHTIYSLENDYEKKKPRFVGNIDPNNPPIFTVPLSTSTKFDSTEAEFNKFETIQDKIAIGKEITPEENEFRMNFLERLVISLGITISEYYSLLNETGKKKADEEIDRLLEQLELLTKIPEYTKKDNE